MITLENITKKYYNKEETITALNNINIKIDSDGLVFLLGESGSGKTSLLNILGLLDAPDSGTITINNKIIQLEEYDYYRNIIIGIIFQDFNLIHEWNVYENIEIALEQQFWEGKSSLSVKKQILNILEYVGLKGYEKRKVKELSGGQMQRIAIARALVKNPSIILADEPTGNLDDKNSNTIFQLLKKISKDHIVIVVSHNEKAAKQWGDRILRLKSGNITDDTSLSSNTYSLKYTDEKEGKWTNLQNLSLENVIDKITTALITEKRKEQFSFTIQKNNMSKKEKILPQNPSQFSKTQSGIKLKKILKLVVGFMSKRKIRFLITSLLLTITFFIFQLFSTALFAKIGRPLSECIDASTQNYFSVYEKYSYLSDWYDEVDTSVGNTKKIKTFIQKNKVDYDKVIKGLTLRDTSENEIEINLHIRKNNLKKNEICITDYCASSLDENLTKGSTIQLLGIDFTIKDIISTDYQKHKDNYTDYDMNYSYMMCEVNSSFENYIRKTATLLDLPSSDFSQTVDEDYVSSQLEYGNATNLNSKNVVSGRLPANQNEIVVSIQYALDNSIITKDQKFKTKNINFLDLHDKHFKGTYNSVLNLYDVLKNIRIVGIVDDTPTDTISVWLEEMQFKKLREQYVSSIVNWYLLKNKQNASFYQKIFDNGLSIDNPEAETIESFYRTRDTYKNVLILALFISAFFSVLLCVSFISYSIIDNKKRIGILRAIGTTKQDIVKLFSIETLLTVFISLLLQELLSFVFISKLNTFLKTTYNLKTPLLCIQWSTILFVVIFVIASTCITNFLPINKLYKKKTIELLKN